MRDRNYQTLEASDLSEAKLMTVSQTLAMLEKANVSVSRQTFTRWVESKYFPPCSVCVGNRRRWTEADVKVWLRKCVDDAKCRKGKRNEERN